MVLSLLPFLVGCPDQGVSVHNADPRAEITSHAGGDQPDAGFRTFTGTVEDPDHDVMDLELSWLYDGVEACPPVAPDDNGNTACEIFLDSGDCTVTLQVEDPLGGLGSDMVSLDVQPYGDPWAEIASPIQGGVYYSDQLITFEGAVGDEADDLSELVASWESSLQGELDLEAEPDGSGNVLGFGYLEQGEHAVTLHVENTGGNTAAASVIIEVGASNNAPDCEILSPVSGSEGELDEQVTLSALVSDADVPEDWLTATWSSNLDGELGQQTPSSSGEVALLIDSLSVGGHTLTLSVADEVGSTCSDFVLYTVRDCPDPWYLDSDGDGFGDPANSTSGCEQPTGYVADDQDCDDGDAAVHPDATETCSGVDDDCDGLVDDDDSSLDSSTASSWYSDGDGDGFGDSGAITITCDRPSGTVADATDCDDSDASVNTAATEVCNSVDDDCDGLVDDDDSGLDTSTASTWYADLDGDGYGELASPTVLCVQPSGYVVDATDCDNGAASSYPGADEYCDGVDTDCDGVLDEPEALDASLWFADSDGDGYGDILTVDTACAQPSGYLSDGDDCDDSNAAVNPAADEYCDGVDNNCDGDMDEDDALDASVWHADGDGDGYGDMGSTAPGCTAPSGYLSDDTDCDDGDAAINPAADESCDGVDNDCDGTTDEDEAIDAATWYADADGDGFGDSTVSAVACESPLDHVADDSDCDDSDSTVNPDAVENCDSVDNDCDGDTDESDASDAATWYADSDGDAYGDPLTTDIACTQPSGYLADSSDCDDSAASVYPGADEYCNGADDDCDGTTDEDDALDGSTWYADADGDGYGDSSSTTSACALPSGYAVASGDCDESDPGAYPGASEVVADGVDQNCDGGDTCYEDLDGDGYGSGTRVSSSDLDCSDSGESTDGTDADDSDGGSYPGAPEIVGDGVDQDGDGGDSCYEDLDGDGYGTSITVASSDLDCSDVGESGSADDCDDDDPDAWPGATELVADGVDQDCDGGDICYEDADGDGYGSSSTVTSTDLDCADGGESSAGGDLDDSDGTAYPGATEVVADGIDQDCDGGDLCYEDLDGDGYGTSVTVSSADLDCVDGGESELDSDCDDGEAGAYPGATEICGDGVDNDCDGTASGCTPSGDVDLATADVKLEGEAAGDRAGHSVAMVGDTNGDGYDDILVGAYVESTAGSSAGAAYLILGPPSAGSLYGADAKLTGAGVSDRAGWIVSAAGDTNADGYSDFLIGAPSEGSAASGADEVYLITGPVSGSLSLASATATFSAEVGGDMLKGLGFAGDVNADGYDDILVGAPGKDWDGCSTVGAAYVLLGPEGGAKSLGAADSRFIGEGTWSYAGEAVGGGGDVNGDGYDDILVGASCMAYGSTSYAGIAYVIFGPPASGTSYLSSADAQLYGEGSPSKAGSSVEVRDMDGDGYGDMLVGAYQNSGTSYQGGSTYLVSGPVSGTQSLSTAWARFDGAGSEDWSGDPMSNAGDVNGDGHEDMVVGAYRSDSGGSESGAAYLLLGPFSGTTSLASADARFLGEAAGDYAGNGVDGGGDVDGDGFADVLIGAFGNDSSGSSAGAAYLFYGGGL